MGGYNAPQIPSSNPTSPQTGGGGFLSGLNPLGFLGSINYLTPQMKQYFRNTKTFVIVKENGELVSMPRYYKNKIF